MTFTVTFHGGPADGQQLEAENDPLDRVLVDLLETEKGEIRWAVFLYRRTGFPPSEVHYWLGDIQVAVRREEMGENCKEMLT